LFYLLGYIKPSEWASTFHNMEGIDREYLLKLAEYAGEELDIEYEHEIKQQIREFVVDRLDEYKETQLNCQECVIHIFDFDEPNIIRDTLDTYEIVVTCEICGATINLSGIWKKSIEE